jgi:hypothetical protein
MIVTLAPSSCFISRPATAMPPRPLPAMTMRALVFIAAVAGGAAIPATMGTALNARSQRRRCRPADPDSGRSGAGFLPSPLRCFMVVSLSATSTEVNLKAARSIRH